MATTKEMLAKGQASKEQIKEYSVKSNEELLNFLNSDNAIERTCAAANLDSKQEANAKALIERLKLETASNTKSQICDTLSNGDAKTAKILVPYLGKIGTNQLKKMPIKATDVKGYPTPKDTVAKILSKMDKSCFSAITTSLSNADKTVVLEGLDAVGYMAFNHKGLGTSKYITHIFAAGKKYITDDLIQFKMFTCLSGFPIKESKVYLTLFVGNTVLGKEAERSLDIVETEMMNK